MDIDESQHFQYNTPQPSNTFKRPRRSIQGSMPLGSVVESASSSPRHPSQTHLAPTVIDHINGLKHLDDQQILLLLQAARNGDAMRPSGGDRNSISTLGSRASSYLSVPSSRVPGMHSDHRCSIASTDSSFTHYSAASSRLSTASSRLSMVSTASTPAPKNFACTFCDKALKSKPYWKSHEEEFHEQRLTWRCPDCEQIFHAGKRFREHHTKLHGCEHCKQPRESGQPTSRKASPCVKKYEIVMHDKDAWGCGFCCALLTTWEERCEHIALHFEEKGNSKWNFTNVVVALLKQPEVAQAWNTLLSRRHGDDSQHWPTLTWEPKRCNRLRYKLETKWDTRAFDIQKLVQDTYDLAEIEAKDVIEDSPETTPDMSEASNAAHSEIVEFKLETSDFGSNHRLQSSHRLSHDASMMDLDSVEPTQTMHHQGIQQSQWPSSTDMSQTSMTVDANMSGFGDYHSGMTSMSTDYVQPVVTQAFQQQQTWPNASYVPSQDLMNFQQTTPYIDYNQPKDVVQVPTSQFANFAQYTPRQSLPSNFVHQSTPPSLRRYVPKLVNISSSGHRNVSQEQPPPPPPKDESQHNRFSRMIMRRRPSQQTLSQPKDAGWHGELQWG